MSTDSILNQLRTAGAALLVGLSVFSVTSSAQQQKSLRLSKIEFIGLKRLPSEQVIATSGLEVGQVVDQTILDAAAQKLVDSGLFKKVGYHVSSKGEQAEVTFTVEEANRNLLVWFDNFIWFTDEQLYMAIQRDVPFFNGTVPEGGVIADKIVAALQRLLNEKKIEGQVEFMPYTDLSGNLEFLFRVKNAKVPICEIHFTGAEAVSEAELIKASQPLIRREYSRKDLGEFPVFSLLPLYRHLGRLRATFAQSSAKLSETDQCTGVVVEMAVNEGVVYSWDKVEWAGNSILTTDELMAAFGMKHGDVADGTKIDKAMQPVRAAYAHKGYMTVGDRESYELDDAARLVSCRITLREGPLFHMGNLVINGLPSEQADALKEKWSMGPGAIFNDVYAVDFIKTDGQSMFNAISEIRSRQNQMTKYSLELKVDAQKQTVDVIMTFK